MIEVFIDGSAGTTGLGIYDRLQKRSDVHLLRLDDALRKDVSARREMMHAADVVFLCLPDDAAREAVALCPEDTILIDASTAHRTEAGWAYGFPELSEAHMAAIAHSKRIANPGCHASGFLSIVYPLVAMGIAPRDYPFVCHSVTGYTGGGKKMIASYEAEERDPLFAAPRAYGLGQAHKHLPEMQKVAGLTRTPIFCPIVADFDCGMCVSVPIFADLLAKKCSVASIYAMFAEYYARHRFISVTQESEEGYLSAAKFKGSNRLEIYVGGNDERILLSARLDNLGKGASGAAVQNMNLALSLDEGKGL